MAKDISDKKALALGHLGVAIKRLAKLERGMCPEWTYALENTLADLPTKGVEHVTFLLDTLVVGINTNNLPK